jgi:hypothetical protein
VGGTTDINSVTAYENQVGWLWGWRRRCHWVVNGGPGVCVRRTQATKAVRSGGHARDADPTQRLFLI